MRIGFIGLGNLGLPLAVSAARGGHRTIGVQAAVDLNILCGHGEDGDEYWAARCKTVLDRMETIGLACGGPEYPNGRRAGP